MIKNMKKIRYSILREYFKKILTRTGNNSTSVLAFILITIEIYIARKRYKVQISYKHVMHISVTFSNIQVSAGKLRAKSS